MDQNINEINFEEVTRVLAELSEKIGKDKDALLELLISRYITYENLEDFYDLHLAEYLYAKHKASGEKRISLSDM